MCNRVYGSSGLIGMFLGYFNTVTDVDLNKMYAAELRLVNGIDPYEIERSQWQHNIDL